MVAVVSGSGLGLTTSARSGGEAPLGRGNESVFVNTTNGNLIIQSLDENVAALGLDLALVRTYNSQGRTDGDNDDGWRFGTSQRLYGHSGSFNTEGSTIKKVFGDGSEITYTYRAAFSAYVATDGDAAHDTLAWDGTTWTWTNGSTRLRETYNWSANVGLIQSSVDVNGNTVGYFYSGNLLTRVHMAGSGPVVQDLHFDYYASTSDVEKIRVVSTDANGTTTQTLTRYYYDAQHRLVTVKTDMSPLDGVGNDSYTTTYAYDGTTYLVTSVTQTYGTSPNVISKASFSYVDVGGTARIRTVTDGEGRVTTYSYTDVVNPGGNSSQAPAPGWSAPVRLDNPDSNAYSMPRVAFDGNGNGFSLWIGDYTTTPATGSRDVIVRRFDRATNTWGPQVVIDSGGANNMGQNYSLSVDDSGNALVAWSQRENSGSYSTYASIFQVTTNSWSVPVIVDSPSAFDVDQAVMSSLSTSIVANNRAAISWIQSDGTANSTYVARWNGSTWSTAVAVDSSPTTTIKTSVAIDKDGNTLVTWVQADGGHDSLFWNRFDASANAWGTAAPLESATGHVTRPQVAMDWAGNAIAIWVQNGDLITRRYDRALNSWQTPFTVDTGSGAVDGPSLSIDRNTGDGVVAWAQVDGSVNSLYARRFTTTGTSWLSAESLESSGENVSSAWQQDATGVATSVRGSQIAVMWAQHTPAGTQHAGNTEVWVARFNGTSWAREAVSNNSVGWGGYFTTVAIDGQGNVNALWRNSDSVTYGARYTAAGTWTGANLLSSAGTHSFFTKSATDAYGNVIAIWRSDSASKIIARRFDKATNTWSAPWALDAGAVGVGTMQTALTMDEYGNAIAVWQQQLVSGGNLGLYANRYDVLTNTWSGPQLIQGHSTAVDIFRPDGLAVKMAGGNAVIAWLQKNGSNLYDVYAARYLNGVAVLPPVEMDVGLTGNAYGVSASIDGSGNSAVVWQQFDNTAGVNIDRIYTKRFTPAGGWGSTAPLSGTTTAATAPQVGFDRFGNGLAIWSQGNDVYAVRYDKTTGWGTPAPIDGVNGVAESTTLSVDRQGNAIAAWIQTDAGIKSLYAARYTLGSGWSAAVALESSAQVVRTQPGTAAVVVSTSINENHAAVAWMQKSGQALDTTPLATEAWVSRWNGSAWTGPEMVSNGVGLSVNEANVAIDRQGNASVFMTRWTNTSELFVNRYNVNTPYSGPARFGLSSLPGVNGGARVAYDAAGNGVAILTRVVGSGVEVYSSRYTKATNTWSTPELRDSSSSGTSGLASVSVDDGGNAIIAWTRHDGAAVSAYSSIYSVRSGKWSAASPLEVSSAAVADGALADLTTAISSERNATVAFLQGASRDVTVARWNGASWSAAAVLDSQSGPASNLSAGIDLDGNIIVMWLQSDGTAASVWRARYTATGTTPGWSAADQLDGSATSISNPRLAFDGSGNGIAVWVQDGRVYAVPYDRAGNAFQAATVVSTGSATAEVPSLAVDALGNAIVAWVQNDGVAKSTFVSRFKPGSGWSPPVQLEGSAEPVPTGYGGGYGNPIASIRGDQASVSWAQRRPGETNDFFTNWYRARWNGSAWSAVERIDTLAEGGGGFMGSTFVDYQGNVTDFFAQWQSTTSNTFTNRYLADSSYTETRVADGLGRVTIYRHDSRNRLLSVSRPGPNDTRSETRYQYDSDGNVNTVIEDARGAARTTIMIYDTRGNRVFTRTPDGGTTRRTYDAKNQLTTEAVYQAADLAGGPPPQPLVTRFYYDGNSNLRFVVSPDGRVTEHRYYSSGSIGERQLTLVYTAATYSNAAYNMTDLASWVGANAANVDRTDHTYDGRGNLLTSTRWATTDSNGNGTGTSSITRYVYDQRGLLLNKIEPRGEATGANDYYTAYQYDAMRRVTSVVEWLVGTTTRTVKTVTYDDASNAVATTLANGMVITQVFDKSGRLLSETRSTGGTSYGTTLYSYDYNGRLIMTTSPTGDSSSTGGASASAARAYIVYDEMGRKAGEVDGDGTLTRYEYDALSQVVKTTRYSSLLPDSMRSALQTYGTSPNAIVYVKQLVDSLAGAPGRNAEKDKVVYSAYDAAGRIAAQLEVDVYYDETVNSRRFTGAVTKFLYTGARLTDTIAYSYRPGGFVPGAAQLSLAQIDAAIQPYTDDTKDRRTRTFYNRDGQVTGVLDAEGFLTRSYYDGAGRLTKTMRFANETPPGQRALGDLDALTPSTDNDNYYTASSGDAEQDIVTRYFYDAQSRNVAELDAEGYLTEITYDVAGNVAQTARYLTPIEPSGLSDTVTFADLKNLLAQMSGPAVAAKVTTFEYDGAARVVKTTERTGAAWTDPETVTGGPGGNGIPHVAFDSAGNGFLLAPTTSNQNDLMVRRYDAVTKTWGAVVYLDLGVGRVYNAKLAMDNAGNAIATWSQDDGTGLHSQYAARYTIASGWTPSVLLENTGHQVDYYNQPRISAAIADASNIAVGWVQYDGTNYSTWVSRWNGAAWFTAKVDDNNTINAATTEVSVAIDTSGRTTVVWLEGGPGSSNSDIRWARYASGAWSTPAPLDSVATTRHYAQVALDASGNGWAVWVQGTQLYARRFTGSTGTWGSQISLSDLSNGNQVAKPTLAISSSGEAVVAWAQGSTGDGASPPQSLWVSRWNGTAWSAPTLLESSKLPVDTGLQQFSRAIYVAMRGSQAVIGWMQAQPVGSTFGNFDIMVSRWNGSNWDRPEAVNRLANGWGSFFLSVGIDGQGNAFAAYNDLAGDWNTRVVRNDAGLVSTFQYDHMDAVTRTDRAVGTAEMRSTQARYDALGRKTQELSAEGAARLAARLATTPAPTQAEIDQIWTDYGTKYSYDNADRLIMATRHVEGTPAGDLLKTRYFYDADGRLRFIIDPRGQVTETEYDALNNVSAEKRYYVALGAADRDSLAGGLLPSDTAVLTPLLNKLRGTANTAYDAITTYQYNTRGLLEWQNTAGGSITYLHYNAFGAVDTKFEYTDFTDPYKYRRTDYAYERRGLLTKTTWDANVINVSETRAYDSFGRLKSVTDPRQNANLSMTSSMEYDRLGRQIAAIDPFGTRRRTKYDALSRAVYTYDGYGNETQIKYDDNARRMSVITPEGVNVATEYNRFGDTVRVTNGTRTVTYTYDANGQLKNAADRLGTTEKHAYDSIGREIETEDAHGTKTVFEYDASNRVVTRRVDPTGLNLITSYAYGTNGSAVFVDTTEPGGRTTRTTYDQDGRTTSVTAGYGVAQVATTTRYEYDRTGLTTVVYEAYGTAAQRKTKYVYDGLGRRIEEILDPDGLGLKTVYKYDASGNLSRRIEGAQLAADKQRSTWFVYDAKNQLKYTVDALGGITENTLDLEGRITAVRRYFNTLNPVDFANVDAVAFVSFVPPGGHALDRLERTVYDRNGRAAYVINAMGGVTERTFDRNGNVTRELFYANPVTVSGNPSVAQIQTAINAAGNTAGTVGANDRVRWTVFDERDRAIYDVDAVGAVTRRIYNNSGEVIEVEQFNTVFTGADKTRAAIDAWAATTVSGQSYTADNDPANRVTKFWYDALGRARYSLDAMGYITSTVYDDSARTVTDRAYVNGPYDIASSTATASIVGLITGHSEDRILVTERDQVGRIVKVTDSYGNYEQYTYDELGNKQTYRNKLGAIWNYDYDVLGRLTDEYTPTVAFYDVTVSGNDLTPGTAINQSLRTRIEYDTFGNVWRRTEAHGTTKARTTEFLYDKLNRQTRVNYPLVAVYNAAADDAYRAGSAVVVTETTPTELYSEVTYDSLGDAVVDRDIAGNYSYRVYDQLGRVRYEVDAEAEVSWHDYDTFGNETILKRFATKHPSPGALLTGAPLRFDTFTEPASHANTRVVTKTYDKMNRLYSEQLQSIYWFSLDGTGSTLPTFQPITYFVRNAFGEVYAQAQLLHLDSANNGVYANTYFYFDRLGREVAKVDPMRYLTRTEYDAVGNVKRKVEYAAALAHQSHYATPIVTNPLNAAGSSIGYDRETTYTYDLLDRLKTETRINVEFSTVSGTGGSQTVTRGGSNVRNVKLTHEYDAVGNLKTTTNDVDNTTVFSYYDVLGRTTAIAEMARNRGDGAILTPLTEYLRDAHGNVVQEIRRANGASSTSFWSWTNTASSQDQKTTMLLDVLGHAKRVEDAMGHDHFMSYTARGDVAKQWQFVTHPTDGAVNDALVTIYQYDRLGRVVATLQPQSLGVAGTPNAVAKMEQHYNAFGEIDWRRVYEAGQAAPTPQEAFWYDNAGRLWRTNSGDGVAKVYLYDLAGRKTAEFRTRSSSIDLTSTSITNAQQAVAAVAGTGALTIRTENRFDRNGRAIEQRLPTFESAGNTGSVDFAISFGTMNAATNQALADYGYRSVQTSNNGFTTDELNWAPTLTGSTGGFDRNRNQASSYAYASARYLYWSEPPALVTDATQTFEYAVAGTTNWVTVPIEKVFSSTGIRYMGVKVGSIPNGTYDFRVRYFRAGESTEFAMRTGTVTNPATATTSTNTTATKTNLPVNVTPITSQTFDRWGNVLTMTDAAGGVITHRYDQLDQLIEKKLPAVIAVKISSAGVITTSASPEMPTQENHYDALGRLVATKDANGVVNGVTVNSAGQTIAETHADGGVKTYRYDVFGNRILTTDELGFDTRFTFNRLNLQTKIEQEVVDGAIAAADLAGDPNAVSVLVQTYGYDQMGRRVTEADDAGNTSKLWYDLRGNVRMRQTPLGNTTSMVYDLKGNMIRENNANRDTFNPDGDWKEWEYDYFGRLKKHRELSTTWVGEDPNNPQNYLFGVTPGFLHEYTRDAGGFLTQETSTAGKNVTYTYNAAGYLTGITENGTGTPNSGLASVNRQTEYKLDVMGRHIVEQTIENNVLQQRVTLAYDAAGRLSSAWDIGAEVRYSYDLQGNRTRMVAVSGSQGNAYVEAHPVGNGTVNKSYISKGWFTDGYTLDTTTTDYYYQYDAMGRLKITRGANVGGSISATGAGSQAMVFGYDLAGNRINQRFQGVKWLGAGPAHTTTTGETFEEFKYDGARHITETKKDGVISGNYYYDTLGRQFQTLTKTVEGVRTVTRQQTSTFNADNQVTFQVSYVSWVTTNGQGQLPNLRKANEATYGDSARSVAWDFDPENQVYVNPHFTWSQGFDKSGTLRKYQVATYDPEAASQATPVYTYEYASTYASAENYQELSQASYRVQGTGPGPANNATTKVYDLNNALVSFVDGAVPNNKRNYAHDANGNILNVVYGNFANATALGDAQKLALAASMTAKWSRYFFANGNAVGSVSGIQGGSQAASNSWKFNVDDEPVQPETLRTPGQVVVVAGDTLRILAQRIWGNGNLWYVLADENGLTSPDDSLPVGSTLRLPNELVSIGNSAEVWKPFNTAEAIGDTSPIQRTLPPPPTKKGGCGPLGTLIVMVVAMVVAAVVTTYLDWSGTTGGAIMEAAVAATAGSIASQAVGIAIGVQDSFDWKAVAVAAISAGVTAGVAPPGVTGAAPSALSVSGFFGNVLNGMISNALTQGIMVAVGLQDKFSWRDVAVSGLASGVGAAAGEYVGNTFDEPGFAKDFGTRLASGVASGAVNAAFGGKVDPISIIGDAFGHALGNSIVGRVDARSAKEPEVDNSSPATGDAAPADDSQMAEILVVGTRTNERWNQFFKRALPFKYWLDHIMGRPIPTEVDNEASKTAERWYRRDYERNNGYRYEGVFGKDNAMLLDFTPWGQGKFVINTVGNLVIRAYDGAVGGMAGLLHGDLDGAANIIRHRFEEHSFHLDTPFIDMVTNSAGNGLQSVRDFSTEHIGDGATTFGAVTLESILTVGPFLKSGPLKPAEVGAVDSRAGALARGGAAAEARAVAATEGLAGIIDDAVARKIVTNEATRLGAEVTPIVVNEFETVVAMRPASAAAESGAARIAFPGDEAAAAVVNAEAAAIARAALKERLRISSEANKASKFDTHAVLEDLLNKRIERGFTSRDKRQQNFAYTEYDIDGAVGKEFSLSGEETVAGTVKVPENRIFSTIDDGRHSRAYDTEVKLLESVAQKFNPQRNSVVPDVSGTLNLYSELKPCLSCTGVVDQFKAMFPNVKVDVKHGPYSSRLEQKFPRGRE